MKEKIRNQLIGNYELTQTSLSGICFKYSEISELIISDKIEEAKEILNSNMNNSIYLQEVLFICCVWNKIELCQLILNQNININFQLEVI